MAAKRNITPEAEYTKAVMLKNVNSYNCIEKWPVSGLWTGVSPQTMTTQFSASPYGVSLYLSAFQSFTQRSPSM